MALAADRKMNIDFHSCVLNEVNFVNCLLLLKAPPAGMMGAVDKSRTSEINDSAYDNI